MPEHNTFPQARRRAWPVNLAVIAAHPPSPVDWPDTETDDAPTPDNPPPIQRRRGPRPFKPAPVMQLPGPEGPVLPLH